MKNNAALTHSQYVFQHQHIKGNARFYYQTEKPCYINILSHERSQPVYYVLSNTSGVLLGGHNIIYYLEKQSAIEIRSENECDQLVVVLITPENLYFFHDKYQQESIRFEHGFRTECGAHFRLLLEQLYSLSAMDMLCQMRIELIILEIIFYQIESLVVANKSVRQVLVRKDHHEKILLAKQIIEEDLSRNHSIPELAKEIGTNVQYLKKYFKQYFGKTVVGYITEKKMEYAKALILTGDYRVSDVARMIGYKYPTHFTTAFKKHFGFAPNSLKCSLPL